MRKGASVCQLLALSSVPRGARTSRGWDTVVPFEDISRTRLRANVKGPKVQQGRFSGAVPLAVMRLLINLKGNRHVQQATEGLGIWNTRLRSGKHEKAAPRQVVPKQRAVKS